MGREKDKTHDEGLDDAALVATVNNARVCSEQHRLRGISMKSWHALDVVLLKMFGLGRGVL